MSLVQGISRFPYVYKSLTSFAVHSVDYIGGFAGGLVPHIVCFAGGISELFGFHHVRKDCATLCPTRSAPVWNPEKHSVVFLSTNMSSRLQSFLNAANGGSGNTFFIRSEVLSVGRCFRRIWPTFGCALEKVITSGTLEVLFEGTFVRSRSSRFLLSTFFSSVTANRPLYHRFSSCSLIPSLSFV
ncbi:hypothetical protein DPMN_179255 [Dreissena polymorpha]|uniref:Uncharacterized protein n=1 Tax=Dreissena polymorpha TaxID=45954 RepID=A0A9D4ECG5_DREPO|nr:hypothetical protein DPMN_179255 [Dreissena polymorpha]